MAPYHVLDSPSLSATKKNDSRRVSTGRKPPRKARLKEIMKQCPQSCRLKSRKPFYKTDPTDLDILKEWREHWMDNIPPGGNTVEDPTVPFPGFHVANRKQWVTSNRLLKTC